MAALKTHIFTVELPDGGGYVGEPATWDWDGLRTIENVAITRYQLRTTPEGFPADAEAALAAATRSLSTAEQRLLDALDHQALTVHQLADRLGLAPQQARMCCRVLRERGLLNLDIESLRYSRREA